MMMLCYACGACCDDYGNGGYADVRLSVDGRAHEHAKQVKRYECGEFCCLTRQWMQWYYACYDGCAEYEGESEYEPG